MSGYTSTRSISRTKNCKHVTLHLYHIKITIKSSTPNCFSIKVSTQHHNTPGIFISKSLGSYYIHQRLKQPFPPPHPPSHVTTAPTNHPHLQHPHHHLPLSTPSTLPLLPSPPSPPSPPPPPSPPTYLAHPPPHTNHEQCTPQPSQA